MNRQRDNSLAQPFTIRQPHMVSREGGLPWINPVDVESITALRNPSDIAIYGVRGANGVIVIKTKIAR